MMKCRKALALLTALSLLAGCASGGAASPAVSAASEEAGGIPAEPHVPVYTYENPDPDMVLVQSDDGDITYKDYRLYLDVNEELARYSARQSLALAEAVERDLRKNFGIEINEEEFEQMAAQETAMAYLYSPAVFENFPLVGELSGLSEEEMNGALTMSFRQQYLINLLGTHFQEEAERDFPAAELPAAVDSGAEDGKAETTAEQERQQKIFEAASQRMSEYSQEYEQRLELDNGDGDLLGTFDGEEILLTDEGNRFVEYMAASSRAATADLIREGEMTLRALTALQGEPDRTEFEETLAQYREQIVGQELLYSELTRICGKFGATVDDYLLLLERPLWLQYAGDLYYHALYEEYSALAEDDESRTATFDEYFSVRLEKALEGSELVNVGG